MIVLNVVEPCTRPHVTRINPRYIIQYYPAHDYRGIENGTTVVVHRPPKTYSITVEELSEEIDELIQGV